MSARKCVACGKDPAEGYASVYRDGKESWVCHGDEGPSCYEAGTRRSKPITDVKPYTPTTEEVRLCYGDVHCADPDDPAHTNGCPQDAEFDRWLRKVKAEALREAAAEMERHAKRTDNRFTEHEFVEAGGVFLLREYATWFEEGAEA